jgi:16S rRNA (guanine527-N7)-methyltransferase
MPLHPAARLNQLLTDAGAAPLSPELGQKFAGYLALLQKWNARTNLTAIRDEDGILSRHFLESILCAEALPVNVSSLLDFGSGAGFPGIPIALIRNEIAVTLAESQNKKAAFLREAIRTLGLTTQVHAARAETMTTRFDCVTLRAVDDTARALPAAIQLLAPHAWLALMSTQKEFPALQQNAAKSADFTWNEPVPLPRGTERILLLGQMP